MVIQKVIVCTANKAIKELQPYLDSGWLVRFCVAESLTSTDSSQPGTYAAKGHHIEVGEIVFIIESNK